MNGRKIISIITAIVVFLIPVSSYAKPQNERKDIEITINAHIERVQRGDTYYNIDELAKKIRKKEQEQELKRQQEEEAKKKMPALLMGLNSEKAYLDGNEIKIKPPVSAFGKTYVDLHGSSILGVAVKWADSDGGYFTAEFEGKTLKYTHAKVYGDIKSGTGSFFKFNNTVYVPIRDLANLTNNTIYYKDGVIAVGNMPCDIDRWTYLYEGTSKNDINTSLYKAYPYWKQYTVNPYVAYSYENMMDDAKDLEKMYPELVKTSSIGKSVEGRELLLVEFGKGDKKVFVCGTHHAREYIATTYLMYAIDRYAYAYEKNAKWGYYDPKYILDRVTFCIVPMVNPDGVNLVQNGVDSTKNPGWIKSMAINEGKKYGFRAWKANVNGVDVNWNYDKDWTIERNRGNLRGSTGFNGEKPNTEPETRAVSKYVDTHSFMAYISFHTQGHLIYFADDKTNPTNLDKALKNDTGYTVGYENDKGIGGSFFDYVYRKFHKATITVELCPYVGNYPYPDSDFDTVWATSKNILLLIGDKMIYRAK